MTIVIRDCISFALLRCDWSRKLVPSLTNHTQNLKLSRPDPSCFPTFQSVWSLLLWALIGIMSVIFYFLGIDCCYWFGLPKHSRNALVTLIYDMFSFLSRFDQVKIKTMRKIIIFAFVYGKLNPAYLRTLNWQDQFYSSSVCRGFPVLCASCMFSCALCKLHALLRTGWMFSWVLRWLHVFLPVIKVWCIYHVLPAVLLLANFGTTATSDDNGHSHCSAEGKCTLDEDGELT